MPPFLCSNFQMVHKGAYAILTAIFLPFLGWLAISMVEAVENIAQLKAKEISHKELIIRLDGKIDKLDGKLDLLIRQNLTRKQ